MITSIYDRLILQSYFEIIENNPTIEKQKAIRQAIKGIFPPDKMDLDVAKRVGFYSSYENKIKEMLELGIN